MGFPADGLDETSQIDETSQFFERLKRAGPAFQRLGDELHPTRRHEGTDPSATIRVVLADDGIPESIDLSDDWRRAVGATGFAAAVTEACRAAVDDRNNDLTAAAEQSGWLERSRVLMRYVNDGGPEPPELPAGRPLAPERVSGGAPVDSRSADRLVAELMDSIETVPNPDASGTLGRTQTATAAQGRLSLSWDATGRVSCEADPDWVGQREPDELREALATALTDLRTQHAEAEAARASRVARSAELTCQLIPSG
jgi:YD repeat-containing protein